MRQTIAFVLAVISFASAPAAAKPDVGAIEGAASAINSCLPVFNNLTAARTPEGFSRSQSQAWSSKMWDPKNPFKIPKPHQDFAALLTKRAAELEACGLKYRPAVFFAEARLAQLAAQKDLSDADKDAVQVSFDKYHAARVKLEAALASLEDRHVQAFIRPTLVKYFLNDGAGEVK